MPNLDALPSTPTIDLPSTPNTVTVLTWGPGQRKSTGTRLSIKAELDAGAQKHIIWAVHGTLKEASLGQETVKEFKALDVPVTPVKGRDHVTWSEYQKQWRWRSGPEVKVVSFAHLPLLYGQGAPFDGPQADLLVIDEDPLGAMIQDGKLSRSDLFRLGRRGSRIADHLARLLGDRESAPTPPGVTRWEPDRFTSQVRYHDTGTAFLQAVDQGFTDHDWRTFREQLEAAELPELFHVEALVEALRRDIQNVALDSHRFGMMWAVNGEEVTSSPVFVYSFLPPFQKLPPTLILDAYADHALYSAVFQNATNVQLVGGRSTPPCTLSAGRAYLLILRICVTAVPFRAPFKSWKSC